MAILDVKHTAQRAFDVGDGNWAQFLPKLKNTSCELPTLWLGHWTRVTDDKLGYCGHRQLVKANRICA